MSRIHEALKKAERERMRNAPTKPAADAQPAADARPSGPEAARPAGEFLRLEDLKRYCAKPSWKVNPDQMVLGNKNGGSLAAEQFRTLRSRLDRIREEHPCRRLLITSALPGEGKTLVASNLAQAIVCQNNRSVLLVDGDLRSSNLHMPLDAPITPGLSEYLKGDADEAAVIQCGSSDSLFFIPGGKAASNPSELLSDGRMKQLLDRMSPIFDWIIVDSPPTLPVADAGILAGVCDAVLLVVLAGSTSHAAVQRARLEFKQKNVVGVILNQAEEPGAYSTYYAAEYGAQE